MKEILIINQSWIDAQLGEIYAPPLAKSIGQQLNATLTEKIAAKYTPGKIRLMAAKLALDEQRNPRKRDSTSRNADNLSLNP